MPYIIAAKIGIFILNSRLLTPKSPKGDFNWLIIIQFDDYLFKCSKFKVLTPKSPKGDFNWLIIRLFICLRFNVQSSRLA